MATTEGADAFFDRIFGDDLFTVLRCTLSMDSSATCDLPEPVSKTTISRWSCCSQASILSHFGANGDSGAVVGALNVCNNEERNLYAVYSRV